MGEIEIRMHRRQNDMNVVMNHSEFRGESEHKGDEDKEGC